MLFDDIDKKLMDIIQDDFPITVEPYKEMAMSLGVSEDDVIARLKKLKEDGIIRRMGAIFDSKNIGYHSTLCAMVVPSQKVEETAQIINEYPGITHNYLRNDKYNMWFTITAGSQDEIDGIMAEIREKSGIENLISLPAVRTFKINVRFSMSDKSADQIPLYAVKRWAATARPPLAKEEFIALTDEEKQLIKELQGDISIDKRPFESMAFDSGVTEEELIAKIRELMDYGAIRRFGAVLRHRNVGMNANAMGVWRVPDEKAEEIGKIMAAFSQISHCYQRIRRPDWSYNLYTMIHGKTKEDCEEVAKTISQDTGITDYRLLYSTRELKKSSMKYF